jgi:radical SAM protein with 4Fe4S-binding SPASM domain
VSSTETDILRQLAAAGLKPPHSVTLAVTNRCNLSCRHCWPISGPGQGAPVVPRKALLDVMSGFAALGVEKIVVTGGEPLTHPDWVDLLSFACDLPGVVEVRLQTNAILITPAEVAALRPLKDRGLIIQTSLEGASPPAHDRVRGEGSFAQTLQGLRLMKKGGLAPQICLTFTEMRHNFDELPDLLALAEKIGIGRFVSGTLVRGGRAMQSLGLLPPTPEQYEQLLARYSSDQGFRERYRRIGNVAALEWRQDTAEDAGTCCDFIETPYITAEGRLYPCVMLHADDYAALDVYKRPLTIAIAEKIAAWSRLTQINRTRRTRLQACQGCPDYGRCRAGCMGRAFSAYGDFYAVEDRCRLRQTVYNWPKEICVGQRGTFNAESY